MKILAFLLFIFLQEVLCQPGVGPVIQSGLSGGSLTDNEVCKSIKKYKCEKAQIKKICPLMCSDRDERAPVDSSLAKLMVPVMKAINNSKLCLEQARKVNQILDKIEEDVKELNEIKHKRENEIKAISCADPGLRKKREHGFIKTKIFPYGYYGRHRYKYNPNQDSDTGVDVLCEQEQEGGGWTIILIRRDVHPRVNFHRNWHDYREGFGQHDTEFWIGNELMHALTTQEEVELRINMEDWEGGRRWAKYSTFQIGSESESYKLTISGYTGDAGDSMAVHNDRKFYTIDRDSARMCSKIYSGGWWWNGCHRAHLTGKQLRGTSTKSGHGINWYDWRGHSYSLKDVTMKIRPKNLYG